MLLSGKSPDHKPWVQGNLPALALIVLLGIALYGHTLNAPWYLDDIRAILENPAVLHLREAMGELFSGRGLAYLTFALNYRLGEASVVGYHLINIAIHLITACLVFLLLQRVFRDRRMLAVGGALVFVAHPLQTQAVTYIVQRMTSLSGLFFFLAIYLYVRAREAMDYPAEKSPAAHWLFYAGACICGALAVFIKQNAAVLPVALILFDRYFLAQGGHRGWRKQFFYVAPFCLVPLWLGGQSLLLPMSSPGGIDNVGGLPDLVHLRHNSPLNYLVTQFFVVWLYLRLLFIPYGQALDYDVPIVANLWHWPSLVGLLGIVLLLTAAILLRKRHPWISAGVLWFFLALAVESTIIPLDPVFEHRLYVPMFGFALVVMGLLACLPPRIAVAGLVLLTTTLAVFTWQRNALWNDPVAFYEDNLSRAPRSERVHLELANLYLKKGRAAEAQVLYERALEINPDYVLLHINLARAYAAQKETQKAVAILREGLRRDPTHFKLYNNLGVMLNTLGDYRGAADALQRASHIEQDHPTVYFNLGVAYDRLGQFDQAIFNFRRSLSLAPNDPVTHFNLGNALFGKGDERAALQAFMSAYRLNPSHTGTLYNLGLVHLHLGDVQSARWAVGELQKLDFSVARNLEGRINGADTSRP